MIILQGAREPVDHLQFASGVQALAAPCSSGLQVWHGPPFISPEPRFIPASPLTGVLFTHDGSKVFLGGSRAVLLELATGEVLLELPPWSTCFAPSPDGQHVLMAWYSLETRQRRLDCRPFANLAASVWSVEAPRAIRFPPMFLADGKRMVVYEWRYEPTVPDGCGPVYVTRDTRTGEVLSEFPLSLGDNFGDPTLDLDGRLIATRRLFFIAVFRADDLGADRVMIRNDNRRQFTGLAFHPSGRFLAATSNDNTVKCYDTTTWQVGQAFNWDIGRLRSIAFSSDGMLAAAGGDKGKIVVWDVDL